MVNALKNNALSILAKCHNAVTTLSSAVTNFVTVVTAKDRELSQLHRLETRAVTGSAPRCDESDTCDSCKATSLNSLFNPTAEAYQP